MKKLGMLLACLALLWAVGLAAAEDAPVKVTDMMGREIELKEPATRVVALTAADCEILCALGCEDALVGRGEYCNYPASVLEKPSVESGYETNIEQIIVLEPQVVLMATMAQTKEQADQLSAAGIQTAISNAQDIEGVYTSIRMIGALMGREAEADAMIQDMQAAFAGIAEKSEQSGKTVYFEVSPLEYGLWTAGKGTFMDELATLCGLTNAFADVEGWGQISEEQVLERNPDYIVTITMYFGEGPTPVEEIMSRPGWDKLQAVEKQQILNADNDEISRPGPRLKNAAETLYRFVYEEETAEAPAA